MNDINRENSYTDEVTGKFKKGNPGGGRPEGSISAISAIKKIFRENPEDFKEFIERYKKNPANEKHLVEMIDGKPKQSTDITSGGGTIPVLVEIIREKQDEKTEDNTNT